MKLFCFLLIMILSPHCLMAYESDQFTLPNFEIADVGSDVSKFVYKKTELAINKINQDLKTLPSKIDSLKKELNSTEAKDKPLLLKSLRKELEKSEQRLKSIQSNDGIVAAVYDELGGVFTWEDQRDGVFGLPLSIIPYPKNIKDNKPITFLPKKRHNIYALAGFHRIISPSYFVFCSSLKMFDVYLGVDKLGHMFNQGYEYFSIFRDNQNRGMDSEQALRSVIQWGINTENGMFGMIVDGVYSNGDLAANYSGFHFFMNLLNEVTIGDKTYPPLLIKLSDQTVLFNPFSESSPDILLKPFITNHLNEAINPSHYEKLVRVVVKKEILKRCPRVIKFYQLESADTTKSLIDSMSLWHGQDYGHNNNHLLRIDELCF